MENITRASRGRRARAGVACLFVSLLVFGCDGDDDDGSSPAEKGGAGGSSNGGSTSGGTSGSSNGGSGGGSGAGGSTSGGAGSGGNSGKGGSSNTGGSSGEGGSSGDGGSGGDGSGGDGGAPMGCMPNAESCPSSEPTSAFCEESMAQGGLFCAYAECTTACVCSGVSEGGSTTFRWRCFPIGG